MITPPKGVKRKDQQAVPFEGLELFDSAEQLLQNEEKDDEDFDDGERSEDQDNVTSKAAATGEQYIIPPATIKAIPAPIILTNLCEDESDLHKVAVFLDQFGKLLSDAETTKHFRPYLTSFNQNYITVRRSVKKRIQRSREANQLTDNNGKQGEADEVEHNQNMAEDDYPNLFEDLLDYRLTLL